MQSEGLGYCAIHGQSSPILQQVGAGGKGICFACAEDAKPKTGTTIVVTEASPTAGGKVTIRNVTTDESVSAEVPTTGSVSGEINIHLTVAQLATNPVHTLLQATYDAIDNMPPFKTLRETKQAIALQDQLVHLISANEMNRKPRKKHDTPSQERTTDESGTQTSSQD